MDNTGKYVTRAQLLTELANAGKATATKISLSNKATTAAPAASYDFTPATPAPAVGDFIVAGTGSGEITATAGTSLTIDDGTSVPVGVAKLIKCSLTGAELDALILDAMAFIDRHTRQWFNARAFEMKIDGSNADTLFLGVPVISVASLKLNDGVAAMDPSQYRVFNGRQYPDDRRNPKITLVRRRCDDIFETGGYRFLRGSLTKIDGVFGFLEADGSTPALIQRATLKLAVKNSVLSIGEAAAQSASSAAGKIKREKTDLHEIEYFDDSEGSGAKSSSLSGDDEVDNILAAYRSPIVIGGSTPDIGWETPEVRIGEKGEFY